MLSARRGGVFSAADSYEDIVLAADHFSKTATGSLIVIEREIGLRTFIESGKKIIISTVQKFPFILDEIGDQHRGRNFAIVIDEAHSSQGGKTTTALSEALAESSFAAAEFLLMDDQEALGQLEAVGDEMTFIQPISADSFERVDFTFFAGAPELTRRHWQAAQRAGFAFVRRLHDVLGSAGQPRRQPDA